MIAARAQAGRAGPHPRTHPLVSLQIHPENGRAMPAQNCGFLELWTRARIARSPVTRGRSAGHFVHPARGAAVGGSLQTRADGRDVRKPVLLGFGPPSVRVKYRLNAIGPVGVGQDEA